MTAVGADLYVAGEGSSGIAAEYLIVDGRKTA